MSTLPKLITGLVFLLLTGNSLKASDWPRYGGPHGTNVAADTDLCVEWPADGPPIAWTQEVGPGYGGCTVQNGIVYLMDRIPGEKDLLRSFDLDTGEELLRIEKDCPGTLPFPGSRGVPTLTEGCVYVACGWGHVGGFDLETEDELFWLDLREDYQAPVPQFGFSQSPLIYKDLFITAPMSEDVGVVAVDRWLGDEVWATEGLGSSHSTPVLLDVLGQPQVVFVSSFGGRGEQVDGRVSGFDPKSGQLLWQTRIYKNRLPIPNPITVGESRLFITGGYEGGSVLAELSKDETGISAEEVFRITRGSQVHLPILIDDHIYVVVNENRNHDRRRRQEGGLLCLDLEGNEKWRTGEEPFLGRGATLYADGYLFSQDGFDGTLRVIKPDPTGYQCIAEANIFGLNTRSDEQLWAPMALSDGRLLMRSQSELKCVDLRAKESS